MGFFQSLKGRIGHWLSNQSKDPLPESLNLPLPRMQEDEDTKQYAHHPCPNYMELKMRFRDIGRYNAVIEALGRDFLTAMPDGAYKSRLGQIGFLYRRMHEDLANKNVASCIEDAHTHQQNCPDDWDDWDRANLREMEVMYRHHCQVDPALMERKAKLSYEGRRVHRDVLINNDWDEAITFLQSMIDLQKQIAESKCLQDNDHDTDSTYQAILREYIPGARVVEIDEIFTALEDKIQNILPWILEYQAKEKDPIALEGDFPDTEQMWLNRSLLEVIGFDFKRGGLYETGHNPVEGGTPDDTRLVIKCVDTSDFMDSMKSALHEGGHGLYIQGLPRKDWRYQPVGQDLGAGVHESQALLLEMILGRTPEFFQYLSPRLEGLFQRFGDPSMTADNLWRLKTRVSPSVDRKNADEVTYFMHIRLRFNLERQLINGSLPLKDLPEAWNAEIKKLLDVHPKDNREGCLQDVHWFVGKFGYFPSYTIGHIMAAQIHESIKRDIPQLHDLLIQGDFRLVNNWLSSRIHSKGRLMRMDSLLKDATGTPLTIGPLVRHLEERYLGT